MAADQICLNLLNKICIKKKIEKIKYLKKIKCNILNNLIVNVLIYVIACIRLIAVSVGLTYIFQCEMRK